MEWRQTTRYNSFNSFKGLTYYPYYQRIAEWLDGKGKLPPPVECSLDPVMKCNSACYYCNSQRYLRDKPVKAPQLTWDEMYALTTRLATWGVRGLCLGGGGESTLHSDLPAVIQLAQSKGLQTALVTNGSELCDGFLRSALMKSRWVGISLDAGDAETYKAIHGVNLFDRVMRGIRLLVDDRQEAKSRLDIAVKVLVLPENYRKLYYICKLARDMGINDFHVRPVDLERKDFRLRRKLKLDMDEVRSQFEKCHTLETPDFRVYTVQHKYDAEFHVKHDFKGCHVSPLVLQACTDRNAYVCVDHRLEKRFKLGSWLDIDSWWGGDAHRALVQSIDPATECSRCTWSEYQVQFEEALINDRMCVAFP